MALAAKVLVGLILAAELGLVYWLPRKLQSEDLLAHQILQQETALLLDGLRREARRAEEEDETPASVRVARRLIARELDSIAQFIRAHDRAMSPEQWQRFKTDLERLAQVLERIDRGQTAPPLPEVDVGTAVDVLLTHEDDTGTP
jgi:hypothetical protein